MSDTTQTNAMAEIALALAMAFFSIMVLTMVSMGSSMVMQSMETAPTVEDESVKIAKTRNNQTSENSQKGSAQKVEPENLIIFRNGQYYDHTLHPVNPSDIPAGENLVLAVDPTLSMSATIEARKMLNIADMTVVVLDQKWLTALEEAGL